MAITCQAEKALGRDRTFFRPVPYVACLLIFLVAVVVDAAEVPAAGVPG